MAVHSRNPYLIILYLNWCHISVPVGISQPLPPEILQPPVIIIQWKIPVPETLALEHIEKEEQAFLQFVMFKKKLISLEEKKLNYLEEFVI